jgi:hypothetical protein
MEQMALIDTQPNVNVDRRITWDKWHKEATRAGQHYWCYAEFVDDNEDGARAAHKAGIDPYEYIKQEGLDLDLTKFGPAWGEW